MPKKNGPSGFRPIGPQGAATSSVGATGPAGPAQADDPTDDPRAQWSDHSLHYELDMLHRVRDLREKSAAILESIGKDSEQTIENVFVESFEVHVRNLVEFFREPKAERDEALVLAVDFLGSPQERKWRTKHVSNADEVRLQHLWDLVSTNALHPKYQRTHQRDRKEIDFDATVELFDRLATAFVSAPGILEKLSRKRDWSRWNLHGR